MNKLNLNIDGEIGIMEKYSISPNELFLTRILLLAQEDYTENYILRFMQLPEEVRGSLSESLQHLQDRGIILKSYNIPGKGEIFNPSLVPINKVVEKCFHRYAFDMGIELFETYPMFGNINGTTVSLRGVARKFDSLEEFYRVYGKTIKWDPNLHKHILELIDWAKNNTKYLNMSISTFVIEHKWEELEALKSGDLTNINYDNIKLL